MHSINLFRTKKVFLVVILFYSFATHAQLKSTENSEGIEITDAGKKVLFYQVKPKSQNGKYERAGYIHPLYSMKGSELTEDFPEDHPHHHGIFWAWHQIILDGKQIADGWTSDSISWRVEKTSIQKDENKISITADVIWNAQVSRGNKKNIVKEHSIITVYKSPGNTRAIDFDIKLLPLVDNLKIGGSDDPKGYGGFCIRLKLPEDIYFSSSDTTITPIETAVIANQYMYMIGSFDGNNSPKSSVLLAVDPNKQINQQPWIFRSKASMQNAVFPGREPKALTKEGWRLKYRITIKS